MRILLVTALMACSSTPTSTKAPEPAPAAPADRPPPPRTVNKEKLAADTPRTTAAGNTFVAPAEWSIWVDGAMTVLESPEADTRIAIIDLKARSAEEALEAGWKAYKPDRTWQLEQTQAAPDKDGWTKTTGYVYRTSPNEKRIVVANTAFANDTWTVLIADLAQSTAEKRGGQLALIGGQLLPKGFDRETLANKKANPLDKERLAALAKFVESAMEALKVPGVGLGIVQGGKVVFAGGFGVRQLGKPAKVDADTRFMIASNTKALTTLMLAKLVDEKQLTWDTAATTLLPKFKLGDADTTSKVLVKHLICACTGMPRQDAEWLFEFKRLTPDLALDELAKMQPTSKFGELFQYSNPLAAAAGYIGGHVAFPKLELGKAYDEAMRTRVFEPLGMKATTFDYARAQTGNFALPHAPDYDDKPALAIHALNYSVIPVRPAGAAWSTVRDVLAYVQMELAEGKLPNGKVYVSKEALLARRAPQVAIGKDTTYGMGLMVESRWGVTVVHHGGDVFGYHSDMMWLPEHGVGAVVLTNGDGGSTIRTLFRRKLLEVLFDAKPEADADVAASAKRMWDARATGRKQLERPANAELAGKLAARYANGPLGEIAVTKQGAATFFDFGEVKVEVASKKNPDGTVSFETVAPGLDGLELVVGAANGKRTLVMRDSQHEYVFEER